MIFFLSRSHGEKTVGDLAVGESLWLTEDGVLTEYFVVQQGNPDSTVYTDAGADGTWILRRDASTFGTVTGAGAATVVSDGTYLARFPEELQAAMREVKKPIGVTTSVASITSKIHQLTIKETGEPEGVAGLPLDAFQDLGSPDVIAYYNGAAVRYWLSDSSVAGDATTGYSGVYFYIDKYGIANLAQYSTTDLYYIRPVMILDPDAKLNDQNELIGL